jgi:hypothetical protein
MIVQRAALLITLCPLLFAACATGDSGGRALLPPPSSDAKSSPYMPDRPYRPAEGGAAARDVFRTDSGRGYTIQVRDYLAPLDRSVTIAFNGAAVVEVRHGSGEASIAGTARKIEGGSVFTVDDGQSLHVTARGEPLMLRAWIYQ